MNKTELVQIITLWFVVMIFIQTTSGTSDNQVLDAIGIVALLLTYLLPVWIIVELISDFVGNQ
jgi:low temperature requirement protein LtrA